MIVDLLLYLLSLLTAILHRVQSVSILDILHLHLHLSPFTFRLVPSGRFSLLPPVAFGSLLLLFVYCDDSK